MNKELTLSILIPTYNRVRFLETTVNTFISQITRGHFENEVEIVIGNDASPDTTNDYLRNLTAQYPYIKSYTNPQNLGVSGNIEKLVHSASAKTIWLFGEDDLIIEHALGIVMQTITTKNPNVIILNTVNMLSSDDRNLQYKIIGKKRLALDDDIYFDDYEKNKEELFAIEGWLYLTNLISPVVFKKHFFVSYMEEAKKYLRPENVYLWQAPVIIGMVKEGRIMMHADVLTLHRKNENHWSKNIQGKLTVSMYDGSEISRMIKNYMPLEFKRYHQRFASHTFGIILQGLRNKLQVKKYAWDALRMFYNCFPYTVGFLAVLVIPRSLANVWRKK